jgi:hypothetical protein
MACHPAWTPRPGVMSLTFMSWPRDVVYAMTRSCPFHRAVHLETGLSFQFNCRLCQDPEFSSHCRGDPECSYCRGHHDQELSSNCVHSNPECTPRLESILSWLCTSWPGICLFLSCTPNTLLPWLCLVRYEPALFFLRGVCHIPEFSWHCCVRHGPW